MRTQRANKYYKDSHGRCAFPGTCKLQNNLTGEIYCTDINGERSDYCRHHLQAGGITSISWIIKGVYDWKQLKEQVRKEKGASFVLPIEIDSSTTNSGYKISNFSAYFMNRTVGVMYTTDKRIEEKYGLKMMYYSFSFLKPIFEEELRKMQEV